MGHNQDYNKLIAFSEHRVGWISDRTLRGLTMRQGTAKRRETAAEKQLIAEANDWLAVDPVSVTDKEALPPSLDKRDYMSLSIYHWPNPDTPDGLPYVTRDGYVNPEVARYDRPAMARMTAAAEALTLTYAITGERHYAAKAIDFLDRWFVNEATRMNPNMLYAQYIPGNGGFDRPARYPAIYTPGAKGRGIYVAFGGMIEGVRLMPLVNLLPCLEDSSSWTPRIADGMKQWYGSFLDWMLHHQHGKDEASCLNNHGSWYCVQAIVSALWSGQTDIARHFVEVRAPERIAMQIEPDGSLPEELNRADAFHYVVFCLLSFFNMALLGERIGADLWRYETRDGRSIRRALDWLLPYLNDPASWPGRITKPLDGQLAGAAPLLHMAWHAYGDERYLVALQRLQGADDKHRNRLLFSHEIPQSGE